MSIPEKLRYGAAELKSMYNRNLGLALAISVGFHLALIGIYVFGLNIGKAGSDGKAAPIAKIKLTNIAPPPAADNTPPPPPPMIPPQLQTGGSGNGGVAARAGNPVPVPDALIAPDVKEFATTTEIAVATPEGGDGTGFSIGDGDGLGAPVDIGNGVKVETKEEVPEPDEFIPVEEEPVFDYDALKAKVKYPDIAKKNGIEGQVVLQVYVSKTGKPTQIRVASSDSKFFDEPAKDAVMQTAFKPAIQNGTPIGTWVTIPVKFQLN